MKRKLTFDEQLDKVCKKLKKMELWIARHIHKEELPLAINLNLCPEAMKIIHERLIHG